MIKEFTPIPNPRLRMILSGKPESSIKNKEKKYPVKKTRNKPKANPIICLKPMFGSIINILLKIFNML